LLTENKDTGGSCFTAMAVGGLQTAAKWLILKEK
jgi:hypothetical protein